MTETERPAFLTNRRRRATAAQAMGLRGRARYVEGDQDGTRKSNERFET
jgi:hypothetical protein